MTVPGLAAIGVVTLLEQRSDAARRADIRLGDLKVSLGQVNLAAWGASPSVKLNCRLPGNRGATAHPMVEKHWPVTVGAIQRPRVLRCRLCDQNP